MASALIKSPTSPNIGYFSRFFFSSSESFTCSATSTVQFLSIEYETIIFFVISCF